MIKRFNYKNKNQLLIAIMLIVSIIIYKLSFVQTIGKYNDYSTIRDKINTVSMIPDEINVLQEKILKINRFFGNDSDSLIDKRAFLIDFSSNYCEKTNISLRLISEPKYENRDKVLIESNRLILQGSFIDMVKYVESLEMHQNVGKISSLSFYKEKNIRTKQEKLYMKVFIQNIINQTDENN